MLKLRGYGIDPEAGLVYGLRGAPMKALDAWGYVKVTNGRAKFSRSAHRMIWEAVHGPIPDGLQINHKNGVKHDNRLCNLELVTCSENIKHSYRIGLRSAKGECNGRAIGKRRAAAAGSAA